MLQDIIRKLDLGKESFNSEKSITSTKEIRNMDEIEILLNKLITNKTSKKTYIVGIDGLGGN